MSEGPSRPRGESTPADIQCRDTVLVHFYPADRGPFHGHPHVMSRMARATRSAAPRVAHLRPVARHRWHSQRENGTTPYTGERFLVSGLNTSNLHPIADFTSLELPGRHQ